MVRETKFYDILEISPDSDETTIKKSYRALALKYHPDKNRHLPQEEIQAIGDKFKEITRAYETLVDTEKREIYDNYGEDGLNGQVVPQDESESEGYSGFMFESNDLFESFFGGYFGGSHPRGNRKVKGKNITHTVNCSLADLYTGKSVKLGLSKKVKCDACEGSTCAKCKGSGLFSSKVSRSGFVSISQTTCQPCRGTGVSYPNCDKCHNRRYVISRIVLDVDIAKGLATGDTVVFANEADDANVPGVVPGDVIIKINEVEDSKWKRFGNDLVHEVYVDLRTALTGGIVTIAEHPCGKAIKFTLSPEDVSRPGVCKTIPRFGMPVPQSDNKFGNLILKFFVKFPERSQLDIAKLRELLPATTPTAEPSGEVVEAQLQEYRERKRRKM